MRSERLARTAPNAPLKCALVTGGQATRCPSANPHPPMRALLVDDHLLFSKGLCFLLDDLEPGVHCEVVNSIAGAEQVRGPFDLILLDYSLPDSQGCEGLRRVREAHPGAPVVMLSGETQPDLVRELVDQGAAGFISKTADTPTLLDALRTTLDGGVYLPNSLCPPRQVVVPSPLEQLTLRQTDVLRKLVQGKPNKLIARELDLQESTVKSHLQEAFRILGATNRTEAVFKAASLGLLTRPRSTPKAL